MWESIFTGLGLGIQGAGLGYQIASGGNKGNTTIIAGGSPQPTGAEQNLFNLQLLSAQQSDQAYGAAIDQANSAYASAQSTKGFLFYAGAALTIYGIIKLLKIKL